MGESHSKFEDELEPPPQPIWATEERFCVPHQVTLRLVEKVLSWSGDSFSIKEPDTDHTWFKVSGRAFSLRDKKIIYDNEDKPVVNLREQLMNFLENNYKIYSGEDDSNEIMKVKCEPTFFKSKAHTTFVNRATGEEVKLVIKGGTGTFRGHIFLGEPKEGGKQVAKIDRPITAADVLVQRQTYLLTIAPNVDVCLITALCIILDEMQWKDH